MHELIDQAMVQCIEETGNTYPNWPERIPILQEHGLPYDTPAPNVIVSGCQILAAMPQVLGKLSRFLIKRGLEHTFLSKEYCCGNNLYRPAIKAKDQEALAECRSLSKTYVRRNLDQAAALGAKRLIIFCSPCYPIYKHAAPEADIIFYPQAIAEVMGGLSFNQTIDYYPGCYRLHKRFSPAPMDLKSTSNVLENLDGLQIHQIAAPQCCYKPEGLVHMIDSIQNEIMVHICTGCYFQAKANLPKGSTTNVLMLPELVAMAEGEE